MPRRKSKSRKHRATARQAETRRLSPRQQDAKVRGLVAINRVKRGKSPSLSAAARAEGTTVRTIKRLLPAALIRGKAGSRIRVKRGDPYSQVVEIVTHGGSEVATARGSRERSRAGKHKSVRIRVLRGELPPEALEEFRGQRVGGQELLSDPARLFELARRGVLDRLDALYVTPESRV